VGQLDEVRHYDPSAGSGWEFGTPTSGSPATVVVDVLLYAPLRS
jgi:hypothetical protein